mmetsp:Transcript_74266/g.208474  ORF Transcript_74266/g.208474 Transcript_74266/m.208474 type:complete len:498 (-) Transcript_74266:265-1758(-)
MAANNILVSYLQPLLSVAGDRVAFSDGQERLEYFSAFQQLYDIFPLKDVQYGEIYNRHMIGNILFILARAKAASGGDGSSEDEVIPGLEGFPASSPLTAWKEDDWDMFSGYLQAIAESMTRKDYAASPPTDAEDATIDEERGGMEIFTTKVDKIIRYIKVHKAIAPIRAKLTEQLDNEEMGDDEYPKIHRKSVEKLWRTALAEEDDAVKDQLIRKIFEEKVENDDNDKKAAAAPSLKTLGELRKVFKQKPLSFVGFDERVEVLMSEWVDDSFEEPRLLSFFYPDEVVVGEKSADALMRLREARHVLRHEGEDPLEESLRLANALVRAGHSSSPNRGRAARATTTTTQSSNSRRRSRRSGSDLYKRKQTATRLEFDNDSEKDEEVSSDDPTRDPTYNLSRLPVREALPDDDDDDEMYSPNRKKARKSQEKKYQGKRPWSAEEKNAIIEGIRSYGLSKWAIIKDKYDVLFELRTSGQIKDCFRTMRRKGEIPEDLLTEE